MLPTLVRIATDIRRHGWTGNHLTGSTVGCTHRIVFVDQLRSLRQTMKLPYRTRIHAIHGHLVYHRVQTPAKRQYSTRSIAVAGLDISYLESGSQHTGTPLILLHGGGLDSAKLSWGGIIDRLGEKRRVLSPDFPGFGGSALSTSNNAPISIVYYRNVIEQFIHELGITGPIDLGGLSMGGGVSLSVAFDQPSLVRKLILVDTYGIQRTYPPHWLSFMFVNLPWSWSAWTFAEVSRRKWLARMTLTNFIKTPAALTEDLIKDIMEAAGSPNAGRAFNLLQRHEVMKDRLRTFYSNEDLANLQQPTLFVHGEKDALVPLDLAREASKQVKNGRIEVLSGAGHWSQREKPEEFVGFVEKFLES